MCLSLASYGADSDNTIPPRIPAEKFAALPSLQQIELSPDTKYVAYITPYEGRKHLIIHPTNSMEPSDLVALPPIQDADIGWFRWANNDRLLISYRYSSYEPFRKYSQTAFFSVSKDGKDWKDMAKPNREQRKRGYKVAPAQYKDRVVSYLPDEPDYILLQIDIDMNGSTAVRRVDINTGLYTTQKRAKGNIQNWHLDRNNVARIGFGYEDDNKTRKVIYMDPDTEKWRDLTKTDWYGTGQIDLLEFTYNPKVIYALAKDDQGRKGLVKFNIPEAKIVEEIYFHDTVDITGVRFDEKTGEVSAYSYTDDIGRIIRTDKLLRDISEKAKEWLPGGNVSIADYNKEKGVYILKFFTPQEQGAYYVLDLKAKSLAQIGTANQLPADQLAEVRRVDIEARDGLKMPAYLTLPKGRGENGLPLVIMPHGGPHARDTMHYDYWIQFLANRGYAVLQPNFRGSTGYGDAYRNKGYNEWGRKMQQDVTDATKWAIREGYADPDRICIIGASYGGYAALMGAVQEPDIYKCATSINGVADLKYQIGSNKGFIGGKRWNKKIVPEGMKAEEVSPYHLADQIKAPVLIIHAKDDPVVAYAHGKKMYKKLKKLKVPTKLVTFKHADHYLDTAEARLQTLKALEDFLEKYIGS